MTADEKVQGTGKEDKIKRKEPSEESEGDAKAQRTHNVCARMSLLWESWMHIREQKSCTRPSCASYATVSSQPLKLHFCNGKAEVEHRLR